MTNNCLFLNIADYYFKINFLENDLKFIFDNLKKEIGSKFSGFISTNIPKKYQFEINIIVSNKFDVFFNRNKKDVYIKFYRYTSPYTVETYYQISIYQFQLILIDGIYRILIKNKAFI